MHYLHAVHLYHDLYSVNIYFFTQSLPPSSVPPPTTTTEQPSFLNSSTLAETSAKCMCHGGQI